MNKQEAIEKIKNTETLNIKDRIADKGVDMVIKNQVIDIVSQIEEPQKPVIPKFVAEWMEDHKGDYGKWDEEARADFVFRAINDLFRFGEGLRSWDLTINEKISEWTTKNAYEFITAILFGYTVEKEKLYTVEIGGVGSSKLFKNTRTNEYIFHSGKELDWFHNVKELELYTDKLTEQEIKKADERLWEFAKEVE